LQTRAISVSHIAPNSFSLL